LGTSTSKEAKEYFSDMQRHRIKFEYGGPKDDHCINMVCNLEMSSYMPVYKKSFLPYILFGFKFVLYVKDVFVMFAFQAFSKKCAEQRKEWLTSWMEDTKRRRELGLPEQYLYEKDTKTVNYSDFVNKELVLFSNCDNERSIPNLVDGLKPGQRKVQYILLLGVSLRFSRMN
jgi:DNA topoisomerase-2